MDAEKLLKVKDLANMGLDLVVKKSHESAACADVHDQDTLAHDIQAGINTVSTVMKDGKVDFSDAAAIFGLITKLID